MATDYFIGVNNTLGVIDSDATISTTPQGKDVELHVIAANIPDRMTALNAIEKIKLLVTMVPWPPL